MALFINYATESTLGMPSGYPYWSQLVNLRVAVSHHPGGYSVYASFRVGPRVASRGLLRAAGKYQKMYLRPTGGAPGKENADLSLRNFGLVRLPSVLARKLCRYYAFRLLT